MTRSSLQQIGRFLSVALLWSILGCPDLNQSQNVDPSSEMGAAESGASVIHGGIVVVMDEAATLIENGAVAVLGGEIVAVGPSAEILEQFPQASRVDARGGAILPGLVNAHTHAPMVLLRGLADDLELMDWLENHIFPAEAQFVDEEFVRWGMRLACLEMVRGGITTFADMYYFEDAIAEEVDSCGLRAVLGESLIDFPAPDNKTWEEAIAYTREYVDRWQGNPRIIPAVAPHAPYTVSAEHLVEAHELAAELDVPFLVHLAEDQKELDYVQEHQGMRSVEYLESLGILDRRVLAAHVVYPNKEEIVTLARRGVGVAHCPQSNMKISAGVSPVPHLLAAGVAVGLGTDGAASNNDLNLWEEIDTAAKLHKLIDGDPTLLPARQALEMATRGGAHALGLGDTVGSLEVGKRADLVVVSLAGLHQQPLYDIYSTLVYATKASDVRTVMVEGKILYDEGFVEIEVEPILHKAREYRDLIKSFSADHS
jgi:5-methylthioadenosine/S-adenosylhomocysteine deaminase